MTWQGKQAYCATCGKVSVLCFAHDVDEAIAKIVAMIKRYGLSDPTMLDRLA